MVWVALTLSGCASMSGRSTETEARTALWSEAHGALLAEQFAAADSTFIVLQEQYPNTLEGREALFYRGSLYLDPRNPRWDPKPAESLLRQYLASDSGEVRAIQRPVEARIFVEIAQQLNLPSDERVPGLQPETRTRVVERRVVERRVVVPAQQSRALAEEVERLRGELAERNETVRRQREELERIRKTLAPRGN